MNRPELPAVQRAIVRAMHIIMLHKIMPYWHARLIIDEVEARGWEPCPVYGGYIWAQIPEFVGLAPTTRLDEYTKHLKQEYHLQRVLLKRKT